MASETISNFIAARYKDKKVFDIELYNGKKFTVVPKPKVFHIVLLGHENIYINPEGIFHKVDFIVCNDLIKDLRVRGE
jgi:hypothetical protein